MGHFFYKGRDYEADEEVKEAVVSLYHCLCTLISDDMCDDFSHTPHLGMQDILVIGTDLNRCYDCLEKYKPLFERLKGEL